MYIISDKNEYFITRKADSRYATTNREDAETFTTYEKADNVRMSLGKTVKVGHNWQVFSVNQTDSVNMEYVEVDVDELKAKVKDAAEILAVMKGNKEYLNDMLSKVDKEICDILHYIENYTFSASEGYKLARGLKEARERRRNIKNQIEIIRYINESTGSTIAKGHLNKNIEGLNNRQYTPRVLTELFESRNV